MQVTELLSEIQVQRLDNFADELFQSTEPDLIDESLIYILKKCADTKSKIDKVPSGNFLINWTLNGLLEMKKEYGI